jgi:type IV pilus assembly protein PilQ
MKKIAHIIVLTGLASVLAAHAQTNSTTDNPPAISTNASVVIIDTTTNTASTNSVIEIQPAAAPTNPPAVVVAEVAGPVVTANSGIPLIQFSDVPLTTAIENLARQAGINYMLDPKIGYGLPDQNGQVKAEPTLSIRWENITAENALLALLDNYGLQLIRDKNTGIAHITIKDPAALPPLITRVLQLKYASVSNMTEAVQSTFTDKRSKVLADNRTSQLVIVATDPEQLAVDTLTAQLDKPTRQVLIEAKLVEVSSNPTTSKGIDWTGTLQGQHFGFGNNVNGGQGGRYSQTQSTEPLPPFGTNILTTFGPNQLLNSPSLLLDTAKGLNPATAFLDADGVSAVLSFLNTSSDAQVVSTPRVVTLDNETANIAVTRAFPVINVTAGTQNTAGGSSITYSNIGTSLEVTPRITANDHIWLKVVPDVSSFFQTVTKNVGGAIYQADEFDSRHFETQVLIPDNNTLVMGGLVKDSPNASYTKVPVLGDIPGLGYVFRSETKSLDKDNLLIFITPTIVKDTDFSSSSTDFLKSKPNEMKSPMNPNTMWDGAKPRGDWSNPVPTPGEFDGGYKY